MKLIAVLAALGLAALLTWAIGNAARGGGNEVSNGSAEIVIEDLHFTPNQVNARVGQALVIRLVNAGTERHDLNFPSLHMPGLEGVESIVEPGPREPSRSGSTSRAATPSAAACPATQPPA